MHLGEDVDRWTTISEEAVAADRAPTIVAWLLPGDGYISASDCDFLRGVKSTWLLTSVDSSDRTRFTLTDVVDTEDVESIRTPNREV